MPTKVFWYLSNRIIVNEHIGDVNTDVLVRAVEATLTMASESEHKFHLVIDARQLKNTPNDIGDLSKIAKHLLNNEFLDIVLVVTPNPLHKFIGNMVIQLLRKTSRVVSTWEEALITLERLDSSLSQLSEIEPDNETAIQIS